MSSEPRVLIVSADAIGTTTGTGVTLRNLWRNYPVSRLGQLRLSAQPSPNIPVRQQCQLPPGSAPADWGLRRALGQRRPTFADGAPAISAVPLAADASSAARRHAQVRAALDLSPVVPTRALKAFLREFQPDIIYTLLGSVRMMRLAVAVSRCADAPIVPHFMDDWPSTLYSSGELGGRARASVERNLRSVIEASPLALCISDAMSSEYRERFGVPCYSFANPVVVPAEWEPPTPASSVEFLFVGGLHLGRWDSLVLIAQAIKASGRQARLTVFAPDSHLSGRSVPDGLERHLVLAGALRPEEVPGRLARADVLVHVESFNEREQEFTRLSLSTKIPQYLAAGRPILVVGPHHLASMETVRHSGSGEVIGAPDLDIGIAAVRALVDDPALRAERGQAGWRHAREEFAFESVRWRLREALTVAAAHPARRWR